MSRYVPAYRTGEVVQQAQRETPKESLEESPEEYEDRLREVNQQKFKIKKEMDHIQKLIEKRN